MGRSAKQVLSESNDEASDRKERQAFTLPSSYTRAGLQGMFLPEPAQKGDRACSSTLRQRARRSANRVQESPRERSYIFEINSSSPV